MLKCFWFSFCYSVCLWAINKVTLNNIYSYRYILLLDSHRISRLKRLFVMSSRFHLERRLHITDDHGHQTKPLHCLVKFHYWELHTSATHCPTPYLNSIFISGLLHLKVSSCLYNVPLIYSVLCILQVSSLTFTNKLHKREALLYCIIFNHSLSRLMAVRSLFSRRSNRASHSMLAESRG